MLSFIHTVQIDLYSVNTSYVNTVGKFSLGGATARWNF